MLTVYVDDQPVIEITRFDEHSLAVALKPITLKAYDHRGFVVETTHDWRDIKCCNKLQSVIDRYTYGVRVLVDSDTIYLVRTEHSGFTPEGKRILKQLGLPDRMIGHNYILLLPLAILFGLILLCSIPVVSQYIGVCKELSNVWEQIKPFVIYGSIAAIVIAVAGLAYRAFGE